MVVGHRGFPSRYPENGLLGSIAALDSGVQAIEIDVQLCRDYVPIVFHDTQFDRVGNFCGSIFNFSFNELSQLSVHEPERFNLKFYPTPIISLGTYCQSLVSYEFELFIEIKEESYYLLDKDRYADKVVEASNCLKDKRIIISYDHEILEYVRKTYGLPIGCILRNYDRDAYKIAQMLNPNFLICNGNKVGSGDSLWEIEGQWFIYDVVEKEEAIRWIQRGVSYLESWSPLKLVRELNASVSSNIPS